MPELFLAGRRIADDEPCYVVAELGHNHGGSLETASEMIRQAARCGVSAVKLQKRDVAHLYSSALLRQPYDHEHSFGRTYGEHRRVLEFGAQAYHACQVEAEDAGVSCFATAFDEASADFLMTLGMPAIKVHSGGLTDGPLLRHVADCGVPILLSTGGGTMQDVDAAVQLITAKTTDLALLHCTAAYPVLAYEELNLRCLLTYRQRYPNLVVGWSGHDSGIAMSLIAYGLGARIIEKHFTLNRAHKGTDHSFSLEPVGMRKLCRDLERAHLALGDGVKRIYASEIAPLLKMRRTWVNGQWCIGTRAQQEAGAEIA